MRIAPVLILLTTTAAMAQYPSPEQAGFHHCVLLYDAESRDAGRMLPHVAHLLPSGAPSQWLFDAFLFLSQNRGPSTGQSYMTGATNAEDWEALLDSWFAPDRGAHALQQAIDRAKDTLGPPPEPVRVIIMMPYPSPRMREFGDVNDDGVLEDLGGPDGLALAVAWYLDQVIGRFAEADLPDLRLWGFYWMLEGVTGQDAANMSTTSRLIHDRGLKHLWIPWYRAPGFDRWRELGFDVAIMQPNYAFVSDHLGTLRYDRLTANAALAEAHGLGVEMETDYGPDRNPRAREIFRDYMAFGAREKCGYQHAATAYFQSHRVFENLQQADDPDARRTYDQLAAYVRGESIPLPGQLAGATCAVGERPAPELVDGQMRLTPEDAAEVVILPPEGAVVSVSLPGPRDIEHLELGVIAPASAQWSGSAHAVALDADGAVVGEGWRRAALPSSEQGPWRHVVAVPVEAEVVSSFQVRLLPDREGASLGLDEITATVPAGAPPRRHLARNRPYSVEPEPPAQYPDRGGQLTDGEAATAGWPQGRSVGWRGRHDVTITLDLGRTVTVDRCVVHCDGGGVGAVYFPEEVSMRLGLEGHEGLSMCEGPGAPPAPPGASGTAALSDLVVDFERRAEGAADALSSGHIALVPGGGPAQARYVALHLRSPGWLMLSEIEVYSGGENVARGATYDAAPRPRPTREVRYPDDGRLLVDGHVAPGLVRNRVCGWEEVEEVQVTVDLGAAREVGEVTVHALGGGLHGAFAPGRIVAEVSADGEGFTVVAEAIQTDPEDGTCVHVPITVRLPEPSPARFVRVRLEDLRGWTLLSEIEVQP